MEGEQMRSREFGILLFTGLIGLACIISSYTQETKLDLFADAAIRSQDYPIVIGSILLGLSILRIGIAIYTKEMAASAAPVLPLVWKVIISTALYLVGIDYIGFFLSTAVFLFYLTRLFEGGQQWNTRKAAFCVVSILIICYFTFSWFHIFLPDTILF
jgi:hypothetical protein